MAIDCNSIYNDIIKKANIVASMIENYGKVEFATTAKKTNEDFGIYQQALIKKVFDKAVDNFYNDYEEPKEHERKYSLYKTLKLQTDKYGMVSAGMVVGNDASDYLGLFDDSIPTTRKGKSLFDTVFVEGWHGGAKKIASQKEAKWGAHPSPGTPYYRKGGMLTKKDGSRYYYKYAKWGRIAERTDPGESPYEIISKELLEAEKGVMRETRKMIFETHCAELDKEIIEKSAEFMKEVFG